MSSTLPSASRPILSRALSHEEVLRWRAEQRALGRRVITTNGCFDILHVGHVALLQEARALGDVLLVGLNSDASVRRLKGPTRPVHEAQARAAVLGALSAVDAVAIFEEDTPLELLRAVQPDIHVKGGDYDAETMPETPIVRAGGGEIVILPLVEGFSTTRALDLLNKWQGTPLETPSTLTIIPARYGSTRFPGKPLAELGGQAVIERVARQVLRAQTARPVIVATDDARIAEAVRAAFSADEVEVAMTSESCRTGTDRLAEVVRAWVSPEDWAATTVLNVQGDEPFVQPEHVDALLRVMQDKTLQMGTLATPIEDPTMEHDPNVVKVVCNARGRALYFSRATIPHQRDAGVARPLLRHLGLYAYRADWLLRMAELPSSPLEDAEKLEQLRALETGVDIGVAVVNGVINIAIDTPHDLEHARAYLRALS